MTTTVQHPEQPDGIQFDSGDLPAVPRAARRVGAWIREWGDGLINVANRRPLYARDLEAIRRAAEQAQDQTDHLRAELTETQHALMANLAELERVRHQLTDIREARAHTCDTSCVEGGCDFDLAGFVDRVDAILGDPQEETTTNPTEETETR